jgi:hypothetical protein
MQGKRLRKRFCAQGFGGPHFTKILRNIANHAMYVKEWESHPGGMKFL